jgi:hypothetical protein
MFRCGASGNAPGLPLKPEAEEIFERAMTNLWNSLLNILNNGRRQSALQNSRHLLG